MVSFLYFQAKPTDASSYSHNSGDTPSDKLDVLVHKSRNELKVNLEKILSNDVQEEVIGQLQSFINTTVTEEKIPNITFNHIAEDVYLQNLHMTFRKLGYHSMFTRYNGDRGMAVFQKKDPDEPNVRRNVYRSRKPNIC